MPIWSVRHWSARLVCPSRSCAFHRTIHELCFCCQMFPNIVQHACVSYLRLVALDATSGRCVRLCCSEHVLTIVVGDGATRTACPAHASPPRPRRRPSATPPCRRCWTPYSASCFRQAGRPRARPTADIGVRRISEAKAVETAMRQAATALTNLRTLGAIDDFGA